MDNELFWRTILADLELQVSKVVYHTLISQTSLESLNDNQAVITCQNPMLINMIEKRYHDLIKTTIKNYTKKDLHLVFRAQKNRHSNHIEGPLFTLKIPVSSQVSSLAVKLNPDYNFQN